MNLVDFLPAGVSPDDAMLCHRGTAAFVSIAAVWMALLERDEGARRAAAVAERYGTLKAALSAAAPRARRMPASASRASIVERLKMTRGRQSVGLADRLAQAGYSSRDAVFVFLFMKVAMPIVLGVLALLYLYALNPDILGPEQSLLASLGAMGTRPVPARCLREECRQQAQGADPQGPARRPRSHGDLRRGRLEPRRDVHPGGERAGAVGAGAGGRAVD